MQSKTHIKELKEALMTWKAELQNELKKVQSGLDALASVANVLGEDKNSKAPSKTQFEDLDVDVTSTQQIKISELPEETQIQQATKEALRIIQKRKVVTMTNLLKEVKSSGKTVTRRQLSTTLATLRRRGAPIEGRGRGASRIYLANSKT